MIKENEVKKIKLTGNPSRLPQSLFPTRQPDN